jgi:hypothetical protein
VECRGAELGKFMARFEEHFGVEECKKYRERWHFA